MNKKPLLETEHHIVPIRFYALILFCLLVLMASTVAISFVALPAIGPISGTIMNQSAAMIIAVCKATLVVMFFMGVRWSTPLARLWAMCGFVFVTLFIIVAGDYGTRQMEDVQGWDKRDESALPRHFSDPDEGRPSTLQPDQMNVRPRP
jgi:cytochrome c oxidase subunit 4